MSASPLNPEQGGVTRPDEPASWIDLYLDDLLDADRRAAFEAAMATDPALRESVVRQRSIDASLKSAFAFDTASLSLPGARRSASPELESGPAPLARIGPRHWIFAAVATIALSLAGLWSYSMTRSDGPKYIAPGDLYARLQAGGFTPEFKCSTDAEFASAVSKRLGTGLLVSHAPDVELLGWAYGNDYLGQIIGPDTLVLMCKLEQKDHVIVLMDKASSDRELKLPPGSRLHLFRRRLGPLVLYEVTPLDQERVLPRAYVAK